jgi:hypothetical protein
MDDRRPGRREAPGAQDPAYRPARPPRTLPPALTGESPTSSGGTLSLLLQVSQRFPTSHGPVTARGVGLARWVLCGIPSAWRSPTTRCPGGNIVFSLLAACARLAPGQRVVVLGEADGMPHHIPLAHAGAWCGRRPSWRPAGVRGGERPQLTLLNLVSGSFRDANLRASD